MKRNRNESTATNPNPSQNQAATSSTRPTISELQRYLDFTVVDRDNNKIGSLDAIWEDRTGQPAYLGVKTGWLGLGRTHVIPVFSADVSEPTRFEVRSLVCLSALRRGQCRLRDARPANRRAGLNNNRLVAPADLADDTVRRRTREPPRVRLPA